MDEMELEVGNIELTENGALAFKSSGNSLVDLFYATVRGIDINKLTYLFTKSIEEYPLETLRLIFYTRDCRNGKGERDISYNMLKLLNYLHPNIYNNNIKLLVEKYGRFEDYLHLDKSIRCINNKLNQKFNRPELDLFVNKIQEDINILLSDKSDNLLFDKNKSISLAAKWAPREGSYFNDQHIYMAKKLSTSREYKKDYRKVIKTLMDKLNIVEKQMSNQEWDAINFSHVPSKAMKLYSKNEVKIKSEYNSNNNGVQPGAFYRHCDGRFREYLMNVAKGTEKINIKGILPHELIHEYFVNNKYNETVELQWDKMIKEIKSSGDGNNLGDATAIVDVSRSMQGTPMEVAIALGIIVGELTDNEVITFSEVPEWFHIKKGGLFNKFNQMKRMNWGASTNFVKVMDLILEKAIGLDKCPKVLFVFSDMQFNEADPSCNLSAFKYSINKFNNYGFNVPQIIFWNLRDSKTNNLACPITVHDTGALMVSGFNTELLQMFLKFDPKSFTPLSCILKLLENYQEVNWN